MKESNIPKKRTVSATQVEMTQVILPQFANSLGNVFGGQIMSWVDICAAVAAQRHCNAQVVTASIDAVHFIAPVRLGHIVILKSQVNAAFRTSLECGVSVMMEDPLTGIKKRAARAYATFVALDAEGRPQPVPPLVLSGPDDQRRFEAAMERRKGRLQLRAQVRTQKSEGAAP